MSADIDLGTSRGGCSFCEKSHYIFRFKTHKPGLHKKMSGRSKRTPTPSQKALEVARHQQQKREAARGAKNVGFAGMGERHACQVEARGREEASGVVSTAGVVQMPVRFILLCVLDVYGETRNLHMHTHQNYSSSTTGSCEAT